MTTATTLPMIGLTLDRVERLVVNGDDVVDFYSGDRVWRMGHRQSCCESVTIRDIDGDLTDLVGTPLLVAEVVTRDAALGVDWALWTFYKFATARGYVTINWYGYSIDVDLTESVLTDPAPEAAR